MDQAITDTNLMIELLNGSLDPSFFNGITVVLSAVTLMELYALAGMSKLEEQRIDTLMETLTIIPFTTSIAKRCGVLARTRNNR